MSFFRPVDAVTVLYVTLLIKGIADGVWYLATAGTLWILWMLFDFVRDYDRCQTELRRMAMHD